MLSLVPDPRPSSDGGARPIRGGSENETTACSDRLTS